MEELDLELESETRKNSCVESQRNEENEGWEKGERNVWWNVANWGSGFNRKSEREEFV